MNDDFQTQFVDTIVDVFMVFRQQDGLSDELFLKAHQCIGEFFQDVEIVKTSKQHLAFALEFVLYMHLNSDEIWFQENVYYTAKLAEEIFDAYGMTGKDTDAFAAVELIADRRRVWSTCNENDLRSTGRTLLKNLNGCINLLGKDVGLTDLDLKIMMETRVGNFIDDSLENWF